MAKREQLADREEALAARLRAAGEILEAADERDAKAEIRDETSAERDHVADLAAFVHPENGEPYGVDHPARRHAALDRVHAKDDRTRPQTTGKR